MHNAPKFFVTVMIWSCITGISITALISMGQEEPQVSLIICAIALVTAAITTTQIWNVNAESTSVVR